MPNHINLANAMPNMKISTFNGKRFPRKWINEISLSEAMTLMNAVSFRDVSYDPMYPDSVSDERRIVIITNETDVKEGEEMHWFNAHLYKTYFNHNVVSEVYTIQLKAMNEWLIARNMPMCEDLHAVERAESEAKWQARKLELDAEEAEKKAREEAAKAAKVEEELESKHEDTGIRHRVLAAVMRVLPSPTADE